MSRRLLRLKQIIGTRSCPGRIPVSKSSWWAGVKDGRFPKPLKLGPRTTVWDEEDIDALGQEGKVSP
ncbi:MAG: AlpA family phage regulatory protein [Deltaproteobacteria bacterium]